MNLKPAVFLDRDGVINRSLLQDGKPHPPATIDELEILPGVQNALVALKRAGYKLIVVTNQPDVARGKTPRSLVDQMNQHLMKLLPLDQVRTCFHDDLDECVCRKPKPGLLTQAAEDLAIDLSSSFMVGDRWRDIEAGRLAGCRTFFIDYKYNEKQPETFDYKVQSLAEAADIILTKGTHT